MPIARKGPVERRIYALAAYHGVAAERLSMTDLADQSVRRSDAEVPFDPVMDLVVTMQRKGILTDQAATDLFGNYVWECSIQEGTQNQPVRERLGKSIAMARELGPFAPDDHKRETDEMWGED